MRTTTRTVQDSVLKAALSYAARGLRVLPIRTDAKRPLILDWVNAASTDPDRIRSWWDRWPDSNVGILTDGIVVLDVDNHDGTATGQASLRKLIEEHGSLPSTLTASTPSGGWHLYFIGDAPSRLALRPGLDLSGYGRFVVAPPSVLPNGEYTWEREIKPAPLPGWLENLEPIHPTRPTATPNHALGPVTDPGTGPIRVGERHRTLAFLARRLRGSGKDFDEILRVLLSTNDAWGDPRLPEDGHDGVRRIAEWVRDKPSLVEQLVALDLMWGAPRTAGVAGISDFKLTRAFITTTWIAKTTRFDRSNRQLASMAFMQPKTVRRSLARLVDAKVVRLLNPKGPGHARRYELVLPEGQVGETDATWNAETNGRNWLLRLAFGTRQSAVRVIQGLYDDPLTVTELHGALGMPKATIRDSLRWLEERSIVHKVDRHRWCLPDPSYFRLALDPETDPDTWVDLIAFYAYNTGTLERWNQNKARMDDEVERYNAYFRERHGHPRYDPETGGMIGVKHDGTGRNG
jgi:DNA-binding transcriptional ArsR family regulator